MHSGRQTYRDTHMRTVCLTGWQLTYTHKYMQGVMHTYKKHTMRTGVHTYRHRYIHTYIQTIHAHIEARRHAYTNTHKQQYKHTCMRPCTETCINTYWDSGIHTYIYTHACMHTGTRIHTYSLTERDILAD